MKKIIRPGLIALCLTISFRAGAQKMFLDSLYRFDTIQNVMYGENYNYALGKNDTLELDLYLPQSAQNILHPVLIYAHAGGLTSGDKSTDKLAPGFAHYFAERGYLVASINYRLGISVQHDTSQNWANIYCATQDAKSAIRYFYENHLEYCVDTGSVFFTGSSAGGSITLVSAYVQQNEFDGHVDTSKYGQLENSSGNSGYSDHLKAIVSCWGGLNDTTWLNGERTPNYLFHGTNDSVVPYYEGIDENGIFLFGSYYIHQACIDYGLESHLHPFVGVGHGVNPNSRQFDTLLAESDTFLYNHLSKKAGKACVVTGVHEVPKNHLSLQAEYNSFSRELMIENTGADWSGIIELEDLSGRKLLEKKIFIAAQQQMTWSLKLTAGLYILYGETTGNSFSQKLFAQ